MWLGRRKLGNVSRLRMSTQSQHALNSSRVLSRLRLIIVFTHLQSRFKFWAGTHVDPRRLLIASIRRRYAPIQVFYVQIDSSRFALWSVFFLIILWRPRRAVVPPPQPLLPRPFDSTEASCACRGRRTGAGWCRVEVVCCHV